MGETALKESLERLDELIGDDAITPIPALDLVQARECVQNITDELRAHASADSILIDRDVKNVIRFIKQTRNDFLESENTKVEKKKTRAKKKSAKTAATAKALSPARKALSQIKMPGSVGSKPSSPKPSAEKKKFSADSLDAFAGMKTGELPAAKPTGYKRPPKPMESAPPEKAAEPKPKQKPKLKPVMTNQLRDKLRKFNR